MSHRGKDEDMGLDLDVYGDGDEATWRRSGQDAGLEHYEEDDAPTLPWAGRVN
jgi:hypothetical protein